MINGQGRGELADIKYGLSTMGLSGCEVIAVYNALEYVNKPRDLQKLIRYMRRYAVLFGFYGSNIYCLGKALRHFGAENEKVKSADDSQAFIISSWTKKPFRSSIHTVFCVRQGGKIKVYNRYNSSESYVVYNSAKDIFGGIEPLVIYKLRQE